MPLKCTKSSPDASARSLNQSTSAVPVFEPPAELVPRQSVVQAANSTRLRTMVPDRMCMWKQNISDHEVRGAITRCEGRTCGAKGECWIAFAPFFSKPQKLTVTLNRRNLGFKMAVGLSHVA